jgi:N-acetylmuramoyl-L-alanine amidase
MITHCQRVTVVVIAVFFLAGTAGQTNAETQPLRAYKRIIAIDPGHGGAESGAKGPDGTTEKAVTLNLAQKLATLLKQKYKVVLTRTDDYTVDLNQRTALANHHKADLFISIHTGGSFVHSTSGILIYHYQDFSGETQRQGAANSAPRRRKHTPILWDRAQRRHLEKSRVLARLVNNRLRGVSAVKGSRLQGAPLVLLQSANMPAILIEIGYLTNPTGEKRLSDQQSLADLAQAISRGIDDYFRRNP